MNTRQASILASIIEEYGHSGLPVGSKFLSDRRFPECSSATIRNEMSALEEEGLLFRPHTSAGRIPTDRGYRYFVETMMHNRELNHSEQIQLQAELLQLQAKNARLARTTAKLLAAISGNIGISGVMDREEFYEFGFRRLLEEENNRDDLCRLAEALDSIDEKVDALLDDLKKGETKIYIGKENPVCEFDGYSMIVSPYESREGERGLVAVIGPKRMHYEKNKSLVEYVKKVLENRE